MTSETGESTARRYLLGQSSDEESSVLEREYFADERELDRIAAVEEELLEDCVDGRLTGAEREQFERHYLASPQHRRRVAVVRRLSGAPSTRWYGSLAYLAIAAVLLMAAGGALWIAAEPPRVFAITLPAHSPRSGSGSPPVVIPPDVDVVALQLPNGAKVATAAGARARIETVAGEEAWSGAVSFTTDLSGVVVARVEVPASELRADDYIVVLFASDPGGAEREHGRYVLRIRS